MKTHSGKVVYQGGRIAIVASKFNHFIVDQLVEGARTTLVSHGLPEDSLEIAYVPGAYELPLVVKKLAKSGRFAGIVALGTVIRGSTPHFDYVCSEAAKGLSQVSLQEELPVAFGVLTTDTIEQAIERAGTKAGNKGAEAAVTVLEMINLINEIE